MFRLVDRPVMPLSTPIWGRNPRDVAGDRRPNGGLVLAPDSPDDLQPPLVRGVVGALGVAKALERDRHLGREAILDNLTA